MRGFHVHEETKATEYLDDEDSETNPGDVPSPTLLGIVEECDDADEEGEKDDAHRGGASAPPPPPIKPEI